jgi:uncharacterized membrane protein (UPF0182 family)
MQARAPWRGRTPQCAAVGWRRREAPAKGEGVAFRAPGQPRPARRPAALVRWPRYVVPALITAVAVIVVACVVAGVWTDLLWFRSVGHTQTFAVTYGTKWAMFLAAALFMIVVTGGNACLAFRLRPQSPPAAGSGSGSGSRPSAPEAYRVLVDPHRRAVLAVLLGAIGLVSGLGAASSWRTWLLFANRTSFGRTDPQFHLDISFFVFDYPFLRLVLTFLFAAIVVSLVLSAIVHYLYGGLRPQQRGSRATAAARAHLFVLAGAFVLLKAAAYWVDRYAIDFSERGVVRTGASYTDVNAILPAKTVLAVIAAICAALFLIGAVQRRPVLPAIGFGLLVLSAVLLGGVYPAIIQQFVVKPNELAKESPFLRKEIASTRVAYIVAGARLIPYRAAPAQPPAQLARDAAQLPDLRLGDPGVLSPAFQQLQQVKGYYQFTPVLDIDRYQVPASTGSTGSGSTGTPGSGGSTPIDMIIGVRAVTGPPRGSSANWVNTHLVYTHGYGLVAATAAADQPNGNPAFTESDIPPSGLLGNFQPRIYFGEQQVSYVIAGGRGQRELDYPDGSSGGQHDSTYHGGGGVPVGSALGRLLYAIKFRQLNILLSGAINHSSRILSVRDPLARVTKVAPFLTLDRDCYPVVSGGQVYWVVDGYTTSDDYPYSARLGVRQASASTYARRGALAGDGGQLNYIRNSVKAVVNAYSGQVSLYQWGGRDPILAAWEKAFPGLVQARADIPAGLLAHLRYPEALFALQRQVLTQFHETSAPDFYAGQDFWSVPTDPASAARGKLSQPPYYLTLLMPGQPGPQFSLATSFTQRGRPNMAAFMAVSSDPASPGYGRIEILQLPQEAAIAGPQQVHNDFESDTTASGDLSLWRKGGSKVTFGNLVTVPVGGGLLYTQPLYVSENAAGSAGSYPALRRVFAYYNGQVGYSPTLAGALAQVLGATSGQSAAGQQGSLQRALQQAQLYYGRALAALRNLDYATFGNDLAKMHAALSQAARLAGEPAAGGGSQGGGTAGGGSHAGGSP